MQRRSEKNAEAPGQWLREPRRSLACLGLLLAAAPLALGCSRGRTADRAGYLRVAVSYDVASLDPHQENTLETFEQLSNVYEPLVGLDRDLRLAPALAASWTNPDATTWAFRLRLGARFHDGSPLTAEDVVYSIERLKGDETLRARSQLSEVTGASVENGQVLLRTARPSARLLNDLSQVLVVRAGSTRESLEAHPNGTGPYAVESWTPRRRLRLRRHEGYWGVRPAHPGVEVEMGVAEDQAAAGIREGRFSLVARINRPGVERAASQSSRYRLVRKQSLYLLHLGFNLSSPTLPETAGVPNPFLHLGVRQAIDLALDRDRIAAARSPDSVPARNILTRATFGYDPEAPSSTRDVAKARRLLEAAGYPNGFDVTLHDVTKPGPADEVRAQLAQIGIRVTVAAVPEREFFPALRRRELSLWLVGDGAMTGEAGWLLATQFHSPDPGRGLGLDNYGGYSNRELDRAIEEADAIYDPDERRRALQRAVRLAEDSLAWVPLFFGQVLYILDRDLTFEPREDLVVRYAEIGRAKR